MAQLGDLLVTGNAKFLNGINGKINSISSKTYSGITISANDVANGYLYYAKIIPTSNDLIYKVHYRVDVVAAGRSDFKASYDIVAMGSYASVNSYKSFNYIITTSYLPIYTNCIRRATAAGYATYGHLMGVRMYSSTSPTDSTYARTFNIQILETENCEVTFFDSMLKYSQVPGTGSTNYTDVTEMNATSQGMQEIGDNNDIDNRMIYFAGKTGSQGIWATSLFMEDGNGTYQGISTASDGTATTSNRTNGSTKKANTCGFKVGSTIFYTNTSYNANTNISGYGAIYSSMGNLFDSRYAFNTTLTVGSLTPYQPVYLVGTINEADGLFYLEQSSAWWTQTPTSTGKVYILVGGCYDSSTSYCRIVLYEHNPWYVYNGTRLIPLSEVNKNEPYATYTTNFITGSGSHLFGNIEYTGSGSMDSYWKLKLQVNIDTDHTFEYYIITIYGFSANIQEHFVDLAVSRGGVSNSSSYKCSSFFFGKLRSNQTIQGLFLNVPSSYASTIHYYNIKTKILEKEGNINVTFENQTSIHDFTDNDTYGWATNKKSLVQVGCANDNIGFWSEKVTGAIGDTSVTITNDSINSNSIIDVYTKNVSGTPVTYNSISTPYVGTAVITFPALTEATDFMVCLRNVGFGEGY